MRSGFINIYPARVIFTTVVEKTTLPGWPRWRVPFYIAIAGFAIFTPMALLNPDTHLFWTVFVVAPVLLAITLL